MVQEKNPTCWLDTYVGGLSCCHHKNILLDSDQNPWQNEIDTYRLKFRFWYEDYIPASKTRPASHNNLVRMYYQTEAWAGEYDVIRAPEGTPPEDAVDEITAHFQVSDLIFGDHGHMAPPNSTTGIKLILCWWTLPCTVMHFFESVQRRHGAAAVQPKTFVRKE